MVNQKKDAFDTFLEKEGMAGIFDRHEMHDEDDTVLYRSYIQTDKGDVQVVIMLDATIYAVVRFVLAANVVTEEKKKRIQTFIDTQNSTYKSFKFYTEAQDETVYLDIVYMTSNRTFEAPLLYVLTKQGVEYVMNHATEIVDAFGVESLGGDPQSVIRTEDIVESI